MKKQFKNSDEFNFYLSDMFDEFLSDLTESKHAYTTPADGDRLFEYEEGITFYYTSKGMKLVERWKKRMKFIYDKYFDDDNFNPTSTYYKEF